MLQGDINITTINHLLIILILFVVCWVLAHAAPQTAVSLQGPKGETWDNYYAFNEVIWAHSGVNKIVYNTDTSEINFPALSGKVLCQYQSK